MPALPDWQPLDQVGGTEESGGTGGRVVAIVASQGAVAAGWAEHATLSLARTWTASGRKVMLVDGAIERPVLHELAGVPNVEGLSDATLYGASVGRVARQVEEGGYFLIPAGTAVADANAVVRSPRWDRLQRGFVEAGVTLAVFVRDGEPSTPAFLGSASEIVVIAGPSDPTPAAVRDLEPLVRLVTGFGKGPREVASDSAPSAPTRTEPRKVPAKPSRGRLALLVLLVILLALVFLGVLGIIQIPGISPQAGASTPASDIVSRLAGSMSEYPSSGWAHHHF
jgi:hypothetical protein